MADLMTFGSIADLASRLMSWYACTQPERAPDQWTWFHLEDCTACRLALQAAREVEPKPGAFRGWWESL